MSTPGKIVYHKRSRILEIDFDGQTLELPAELLRVNSPSAEVRGHGSGQQKLQTGKKHVGITAIEPVGNYAIRIVFDDGHDTGLYPWEMLEDIGCNEARYWQEYLNNLEAANASRLPTIPVGQWTPKSS